MDSFFLDNFFLSKAGWLLLFGHLFAGISRIFIMIPFDTLSQCSMSQCQLLDKL